MCDRLAQTTRELVTTHSKLYDVREEPPRLNMQQYKSPDIESITSSSTVNTTPITSTTTYQPQPSFIPPTSMPTYTQQPLTNNLSNDIDFNSCEFLYDSALFGQIIFDTNNNKYLPDNSLNFVPSVPSSSLLFNSQPYQQQQ